MYFDDDLTAAVKSLAAECGFARVGIAPAGPIADGQLLRQWLNAGYQAGMDYMAANLKQRLCPAELVPGAKSVICLAASYAPAEQDQDTETPAAAFVARYACGRDYHKVLKKRAQMLCDRIREAAPQFEGRAFVDTAPVAERSLAVTAGLGWPGRNGVVVAPGLGSYVLLAEIICNLPLRADRRLADGCGECSACVSACPTGAITGYGLVDANLCLSYHLIENRGGIPAELWPRVGNRVFGCDSCQLACPHNRATAGTGDPELLPPAETPTWTLEQILRWRQEDWHEATQGSARRRATLFMWRRNAVLAAGCSGKTTLSPALEDLRDVAPELAEEIDWAIGRLRTVNDD